MSFWFKKTEKDPVCNMDVNTKKPAATHEHDGKTYYFCAIGCKTSFVKNPEKFLNPP